MAVTRQRTHDELTKYYDALGPIRDLVLDDSLTEIMVNGPKQIYVERNGKILLTDRQFDDDNHLLRVIDFIVSAVGRRIDFRSPMADARVWDGSRVNARIAPPARRAHRDAGGRAGAKAPQGARRPYGASTRRCARGGADRYTRAGHQQSPH